jgi:hypothetical protein
LTERERKREKKKEKEKEKEKDFLASSAFSFYSGPSGLDKAHPHKGGTLLYSVYRFRCSPQS